MEEFAGFVGNIPKKVLPKIARVTGVHGHTAGDVIKLTYIGEIDGLKTFLVGDLPTREVAAITPAVRLELDNTYEGNDTVKATILGPVNGDELLAIHPRLPKILYVEDSMVMSKDTIGKLTYALYDPDNPAASMMPPCAIKVESTNPDVFDIWADERGTIRYTAKSDGEAYVSLYIVTGTGGDFRQITVTVDSTLPQIKFLPNEELSFPSRGMVQVRHEISFPFEVLVDPAKKFTPQYGATYRSIDLYPPQEGKVRLRIDEKKRALIVTPEEEGMVSIRLYLMNAGKNCYADVNLKIFDVLMNE